MSKRIKYTDGPMGRMGVITDFLPPPEILARAEVRVKITIALSADTINYFKKAADKHRTPYQKIIRRVLDAYARRYPKP